MNSQFLIQLLPLVALFAIMYFLLIRPQRKREKQVNLMRNGIKVGDEILTIGGIYGKVTKTKEDKLTIEVGSDKTRFEIARWAVSSLVNAAPEKKDNRPEEVVSESSEATLESSENEAGQKKKNIMKKALRKN